MSIPRLFPLLGSLVLAAPARAQDPDVIDADRVLDQARSAQRSFEFRRRALLPLSHGGRGRCDVQIGRFCYWYDEGDTTLPAEPAPVRAARASFLTELERFHQRLPGDDWVLGQRVRYLAEHGDTALAAALTASCADRDWWCHALGGFARHAAGQFDAAERAFERSLAAMPEEIRCEWTDWSKLLEDEAHARFEDLACAARRPFADTVLWLSAPLLGRPGNDLRTELLSRRVMDRLLRASRSPQHLPWGRDVSELLMRYGWPVRWSVTGERWGTLEPASVVGHEPSPAFTFFPTPTDDSAAPWRFDLARSEPRSRYAPAYTRHFVPIEHHQLARFPRGDSMVIVAAADLRHDTAFASGPLPAALAASPGPDDSTRVAEGRLESGVATLLLAVQSTRLLVGIEVTARAAGRIARARAVIAPIPGGPGPALSDPLLFRIGEALPATLAEAAKRALPSTRWRRAEPVGVYWELAGAATDSVDVAVAVIPERRGLLGRIGQSLSLVKRRAPLTLQWSIPERGQAVVGRAFELDLAHLAPGTYLLVLAVTAPDGTEQATQRQIELLK